MIDREISHYRIIEKLGSGGMGGYRARDERLARCDSSRLPICARISFACAVAPIRTRAIADSSRHSG